MIKTVIFDFGGVLGCDANKWEKDFPDIIKATGLNPDELNEIFFRYWFDVKVDKKSLVEFFKDVSQEAKKEISVAELEKMYKEDVNGNLVVFEIARKVKEKGYDVVILANESKFMMDIKVKSFPVKEIFSKVYCSAYTGVAKPNKEAFEYALNDLGLSKGEVLFIDNQDNNVKAAREFGIKTIQFENAEQLKRELAKYSIVI